MNRFKTKSRIVEGWLFTRDKLEKPEEVPLFVKERLSIINNSQFMLLDPETQVPYIEVLEGQWLMNVDGMPYPFSQEAVDLNFDVVLEEETEVKGNA